VELSKEFVRQYYRSIGYHAKLMEAREKGLPEPEIPPLPNDMIEKTSQLYKELYEKITGKKW
ncbi:MAG: phosphoribosylaminoimidazolesuccinocarboxamide synthase, partial [Thermoplasmata archaeon]